MSTDRESSSASAGVAVTARRGVAAVLLLLSAGIPSAAASGSDAPAPTREYWAYVCAESDDTVSLVRFGPDGVEESKRIEVGSFPAETEGPHGINLSADGRYWFVSIAHGQPFGSIHKFSTGDDEWLGDAAVGMFPATLDVASTTGLLYVVNSDFYGDHLPSTVSVVETASMTEVQQIPTGTMPHGARLSRDGRRLYSVNMMDDELVEIDALRFEIRRRLPLASDGSHVAHRGSSSAPSAQHGDHHRGHAMKTPSIEPAWVTAPSAAGRVYVTGLSGNVVLEVDLEEWRVTRSFETAPGPYNAAVSPDGSLLAVTYKKGDAVGFWDLTTGEETARIATTRRIPHGLVITDDGRYTFVTVEGVGGEPGVVEIFDNRTLERAATLEIGKQAGGIALWAGPGS